MTKARQEASGNNHRLRNLAIVACVGYTAYAAWDAGIFNMPATPMHPGHFVDDVPFTSFEDLAKNMCPEADREEVVDWLTFYNRPVEPGAQTADLWLPVC